MKSLVVQELDLVEMTMHPLLNVSKNLSFLQFTCRVSKVFSFNNLMKYISLWTGSGALRAVTDTFDDLVEGDVFLLCYF
jgi:hypothetical protein